MKVHVGYADVSTVKLIAKAADTVRGVRAPAPFAGEDISRGLLASLGLFAACERLLSLNSRVLF